MSKQDKQGWRGESRPYDMAPQGESLVDVRQVYVLVSLEGVDWRVTFYPEGGIELSESMKVNGKREWFVPSYDQDHTLDRVTAAALESVGGVHPFKRVQGGQS